MTSFENSINAKLIEENQYDQHKKLSVSEGLQDGTKQPFVVFTA